MFNRAPATPTRTPKVAALPLSLVAHDLAEVENIFSETLAPFRSRFGPIVNHLKHYRGKRLRPALVLLAGHASGRVTHAHHVLGAVVEMVHTATLVHDDVLDEADTRRHVRTVNAGWGNKTSILLGDLLISAAFRLCSTVDASACELVGSATNRVCAGELLQVTQAGNTALTEDEYFEIVTGKTGALTECCTRLGAHYAGASPVVIEALARYGSDLGVAFQIADDILDICGDEDVAGKTLGTDIEQQKMTLPLIRALEELPEAEAERLREALRTGSMAAAAEIVTGSGTMEEVQEEARRIATSAKRCLTVLHHSPYRAALETLADWAVRRDR